MVLSLLDVIEHWSAQSPSTQTWTVSVLVVAFTGFLWGFARRSPRGKSGAVAVGNGRYPTSADCLPELLKDDLAKPKSVNGIVNGLAFDREISVPFEVGDVRVSKILVHPIKVGSVYTTSPSGLRRHLLTGRSVCRAVAGRPCKAGDTLQRALKYVIRCSPQCLFALIEEGKGSRVSTPGRSSHR